MRGELQSQIIPIEAIVTGARMRPADPEGVARLADSMRQIGLRTPVTVRWIDDADCELVTGLHRLEAAKRLGWDVIEAYCVEGWSDDEVKRWEIAENLHRAELTALERSEHIAEWIRLTERISAQVAPKMERGRPEAGVNKAARELGIERTQAQRAVKIDSITPEAKEVAKHEGLSISQRALLAIAKAPPEKQVEVARTYKVAPDPVDDEQATENQLAALMNAWNKAGPDARRMFLDRVA